MGLARHFPRLDLDLYEQYQSLHSLELCSLKPGRIDAYLKGIQDEGHQDRPPFSSIPTPFISVLVRLGLILDLISNPAVDRSGPNQS